MMPSGFLLRSRTERASKRSQAPGTSKYWWCFASLLSSLFRVSRAARDFHMAENSRSSYIGPQERNPAIYGPSVPEKAADAVYICEVMKLGPIVTLGDELWRRKVKEAGTGEPPEKMNTVCINCESPSH